MDMKISAYRQSVQNAPLKEGDVVYASNIKEGKDGKYILNINGKNVEALSKDILSNPPVKLQIIKTAPLEVEIAKQNSPLSFNVGDKVKVKVIAIKDGKLSLSMKALNDVAAEEIHEETIELPESEELTTTLGSLFANIKLD